MEKYNVLDLFCGCGGMSWGLAKKGFNIVAGFDDSVMQNPIGEADLEWILHRNCESTEQLQTAIIR